MTKILVIVLGLVVAYWLLKRYRKGLSGGQGEGRVAKGEDMVRCERCGLHLPRSESIAIQSQYFCSADHAREHRRPEG